MCRRSVKVHLSKSARGLDDKLFLKCSEGERLQLYCFPLKYPKKVENSQKLTLYPLSISKLELVEETENHPQFASTDHYIDFMDLSSTETARVSKMGITKPRNSETPKQRNTETAIFSNFFFLEHQSSQRNKFSWYWFCWEICGICNEGLQTWMSRCAIDSLDKQSGWKLLLSLVEKYIQTKVSYLYYCILSEKRRNLTQIKVQTFADAKLGTFRSDYNYK